MANLLMLELISRYTRPVILLNQHINCLIDTGADTPVWTEGDLPLIKEFNAVLVEDKNYILSGFGKMPEIVPVYRIPELILKNDDDKIIFRDMTVACTSRPYMIAPLIIPATVFSKMNYTFRNIGVAKPRLEIEHEKTEYYVRPMYSAKDKRYIQRVFSFAVDDTELNEKE